MKRPKVKYIIHNPNTVETTADYLLKVLMESNIKKLERAIQEVADKHQNNSNALAEECV